jgi:hypothetical protein
MDYLVILAIFWLKRPKKIGHNDRIYYFVLTNRTWRTAPTDQRSAISYESLAQGFRITWLKVTLNPPRVGFSPYRRWVEKILSFHLGGTGGSPGHPRWYRVAASTT